MFHCVELACSQKAMTLIEVMLALLLFSVGILAVASLQVTGFRITQLARTSMVDTFAVSEQLELLYAMPSKHAWLMDSDDGYRPQQPDHGPFYLYRSPASIEWEVGTALPVPNAKRISVTLHRTQSRGHSRKLTYDSLKAEPYEIYSGQ